MTVDRLVATDLTVSTSYLYSGGTHLPLFTDANMPAASNTLFGPHAQVGVKFSQ